jgi:hypothetical protein
MVRVSQTHLPGARRNGFGPAAPITGIFAITRPNSSPSARDPMRRQAPAVAPEGHPFQAGTLRPCGAMHSSGSSGPDQWSQQPPLHRSPPTLSLIVVPIRTKATGPWFHTPKPPACARLMNYFAAFGVTGRRFHFPVPGRRSDQHDSGSCAGLPQRIPEHPYGIRIARALDAAQKWVAVVLFIRWCMLQMHLAQVHLQLFRNEHRNGSVGTLSHLHPRHVRDYRRLGSLRNHISETIRIDRFRRNNDVDGFNKPVDLAAGPVSSGGSPIEAR